MTPIAQLNHEHQVIRSALKLLEAFRDSIRQQGTIVSSGSIMPLLDFFEHYVDRIHHGKEERYLFPELEKIGVSKELGPIGVMLREHESGRQMLKAIRTYLVTPVEKSVNLAPLTARISDYIELLERHIEKETNVLFQIAINHLTQSSLETMQADFDRETADQRVDYLHYHKLIDQLQRTLPPEQPLIEN